MGSATGTRRPFETQRVLVPAATPGRSLPRTQHVVRGEKRIVPALFPENCPRAALRWHLPAHKELGTALVQRGRIACVTVGPGRSPDAAWMAMPAEKKNRQS